MAENVKVVSPLSVASRRLDEKKGNVIEQLQVVQEYMNRLCLQRNQLNSKLEEECDSIEYDVNLLKNALDDKKGALIEEVKARRGDEMRAVSLHIDFAKEALSNTAKVCIVQAGHSYPNQTTPLCFVV